MRRKSILSVAEQNSLVKLTDELRVEYHTLSETDLALIHQHRGAENRLGFAVQLCYMRYPSIVLPEFTCQKTVEFIAHQLSIDPELFDEYGKGINTIHKHSVELQTFFGFKQFSALAYQQHLTLLESLALQSDKAMVLATRLVENLRAQQILLPSFLVIEQLCSEVIIRANRQIYQKLTVNLSAEQRGKLDELLKLKPDSKLTWLAWLRQSPRKVSSVQILEHIERLKKLQTLQLEPANYLSVHQNRFLKIARDAGQMTAHDLAKFEQTRRYATLIALAIETIATLTDEVIDLNDRILGNIFNAAKKKHQQQFQHSGKAINQQMILYGKIGQALLDAKQNSTNAFEAIETVLSWEAFEASITEAQSLTQAESFDSLSLIISHYSSLRRYSSEFLAVLKIQVTPSAQGILAGIEVLRGLNAENNRKLPADTPTDFVRKRWKNLVISDTDTIDRRYYEFCVLSELKNVLRSGDAWVNGSRQFRDFNTYLMSPDKFNELKQNNNLNLPLDGSLYLEERLALLEKRLTTVNALAAREALPDASVSDTGLKITPFEASFPDKAKGFVNQVNALLPRVKITELLLEVDQWTNFTEHFLHLKSGETAKNKTLLLTAILADGINLGLNKMANSCPEATYDKLAWLQAWHIRDETYSAALAILTNAQLKQPFATHWGDGTTSSSDGQFFKTADVSQGKGQINPKHGSEPGQQFYTHVSDQYSPFSSRILNVGVRDATYVLDGLLYHGSDLRIEEHYTDTAGFTDQVFGMMHLLGFKLAPRIKNLADTKLFTPPKQLKNYATLQALIGEEINVQRIQNHWEDILRLTASIQQGTASASLLLRKLSHYPRQNGLALALRELGRIERTLFVLDWLESVELRKRVNAGLNKGESRNALARAVFFNRLGEIRDRSYEQQSYRASGLALLTGAIILWNTVYIEKTVQAMKERSEKFEPEWCQYLSPLGWEHIGLTGDYIWRNAKNSPQKSVATNF
jgi:TnpA family transposase